GIVFSGPAQLPRLPLAPPDDHSGYRQHENRHTQDSNQDAPRQAENPSAMDRCLQLEEPLAPGALTGDFLPQQATVRAVEKDPGIAFIAGMIAKTRAIEVVFEAVVQLGDGL